MAPCPESFEDFAAEVARRTKRLRGEIHFLLRRSFEILEMGEDLVKELRLEFSKVTIEVEKLN